MGNFQLDETPLFHTSDKEDGVKTFSINQKSFLQKFVTTLMRIISRERDLKFRWGFSKGIQEDNDNNKKERKHKISAPGNIGISAREVIDNPRVKFLILPAIKLEKRMAVNSFNDIGVSRWELKRPTCDLSLFCVHRSGLSRGSFSTFPNCICNSDLTDICSETLVKHQIRKFYKFR